MAIDSRSSRDAIENQIIYHRQMEQLATRSGDFTKAEHHRKMQEILVAMKEAQPFKTPEEITDEDYKVAPTSTDGTISNRSFPDWRNLYVDEAQVEKLPWFTKDLDPDLRQELDARKIKAGKFLDLGTGPATQAILLSKLGFDVIATDISDSAIARARNLSNDAKFLLDDILDSKLQDNEFDYIFDRGCFHTLDPADRRRYVTKVWSLLKEDGLLFLKTFSIMEPRTFGPYRFSVDMMDKLFSQYFEIQSSTETVFQGTLDILPKALFAVMRKMHRNEG